MSLKKKSVLHLSSVVNKMKVKMESAKCDVKALLAKELGKTFVPFKEAKIHIGNGAYLSFEYSTKEELKEFTETIAKVAIKTAKELK